MAQEEGSRKSTKEKGLTGKRESVTVLVREGYPQGLNRYAGGGQESDTLLPSFFLPLFPARQSTSILPFRSRRVAGHFPARFS